MGCERNVSEDMKDLANFEALQFLMNTLADLMQEMDGVDTAVLARLRQLGDVIGRVEGALKQPVNQQHGEG